MSATKILWGQLIVVGLIALAFVWAATQWTAWRLGYQPQLGTPWFEMRHGWPVYLPPAFFWWWYSFDAYAPRIFVEGACIASAGGFASRAVAIAMSVWRAREAREVTTYGSARFSTEREVRAAGMLGEDGAILGRLAERYLRHDGPEHVLCFAPTRSGKSVGLVVPTLLTWPGSAIVHDIKGENWTLTAGWRARFGRVLKIDPTDPESDAYNPLLEVRRGDYEVRDVQNIADILVDPEGALEKRNHWEKTSHSLLVGAILHVLYAEPDKTLAGVAQFLSDPKRPIESTLRAMMTTAHLGPKGVHPVVASAARELLNKSENERSGVLSTAMSFQPAAALPGAGRRLRRLPHPESVPAALSSRLLGLDLLGAAHHQRPVALAEHAERLPRRAEHPGHRRRQPRHHEGAGDRADRRQPGRRWRPAGDTGGQPASRLAVTTAR